VHHRKSIYASASGFLQTSKAGKESITSAKVLTRSEFNLFLIIFDGIKLTHPQRIRLFQDAKCFRKTGLIRFRLILIF